VLHVPLKKRQYYLNVAGLGFDTETCFFDELHETVKLICFNYVFHKTIAVETVFRKSACFGGFKSLLSDTPNGSVSLTIARSAILLSHSTISNRHNFVSFQACVSVQQAILLRMYSIIKTMDVVLLLCVSLLPVIYLITLRDFRFPKEIVLCL